MLSALDFNYMNESWMEIKEQHLPESYSEYIKQFLGNGEKSYSFLEPISLLEDSYFYLKYKSNDIINFQLNDDYILPSSNQTVTVLFPLSKSTILDSFKLTILNGNEDNQVLESGIIPIGKSDSLKYSPNGIIDINGKMILFLNSFQKGNSFKLVFHSDTRSEKENIYIEFSDTIAYGIKARMGVNQYWFNSNGKNIIDNEIRVKTENTILTEIESNISYDIDEAMAIDLEEFINYDIAAWRKGEYELFRWDLFPEMLLIDTLSYEIQSSFFKRLAFYTEKKISVGELMEDEILQSLHGWNAHDYKSEDLARFFNEAEKQNFPLNTNELLLKELLLENEILKQSGDRVRPSKGGILSISRESSDRLRWLFLTHECYHGLFFSSDEYVIAVTEIWNNMVDEERNFWRIFLDMYGYNINDEYLLINEFQAYLMQQDISLADSYFRSKIQWILGLRPQLKTDMDYLLSEYGDTFSRNAEYVENAAYSLTGIRAGDLVLKRKK